MTLAELRGLVREQHLDGQTVLAGCQQWAQWIAEMQLIERFTDPTVAERGFPQVFSSLERPRVSIVLYATMHPDESRIVKDWDGT